MKHVFFKTATILFICSTIIGLLVNYNTIEVNAQELSSLSRICLGDVDKNGTVELIDAQLVLKASLRIITMNESDKVIADVNKDGEITLSDAQLVLKKALNIIDGFEDSESIGDNKENSHGSIDDNSGNKDNNEENSSEDDKSDNDEDSNSNIKDNCLKLKEYLQTESLIHNLDEKVESVIMISFDEETDEFLIIHTKNLQENGELNEGYIMSLSISTDGKSVVQGEYIYKSDISVEQGLTYMKFNAKDYSNLDSEYFYDTDAYGISAQELETAAIDILDVTIDSADSLIKEQFSMSLSDIGFSIK